MNITYDPFYHGPYHPYYYNGRYYTGDDKKNDGQSPRSRKLSTKN